ncbi:hypothetical protein CD30_13725 [Ureibacillus massiliensis 4400831 = CIP 108448 = CCUG 49529]|uniref:Uncharacterized protein n=1 Tax=Ureibacillus massiliensis 4400831 = CIP 108448 = CCUG 49529 TaxID=1211035 RepID=A0A0A3JSP4_9BACL|nr:glycosyltransferase family 1 protein [Ureibacillus massiliensis]KGR90032.1 hypothetical protein CD30_13725 [Ureibacillus massiliensis 4400831 = CIP 108448 = CCUG 49529]
MRIIIDGRLASPFHGIGKHTIALIDCMSGFEGSNITVLYNNDEQKKHVISRNVEWLKINAAPFTLNEQIEIPLKLKKVKYDIFHSPYYTAPFFVKNLVLTIHDIIPATFKEDFGILKFLYYKIYIQLLVQKSKYILTVSGYSKEEIIRFFKVNENKVREIYSYNFDDVKYIENSISPTIFNPYFIYVGNKKRYKNANIIVESIIKLRSKGYKIDLVLVGDFEDYHLDFIHIKRNISKEELYGLYEFAIALLYPSLCEGFGLPLVEAMSKGLPIIASNRGPIFEVVGDAGVIIEPSEKEFTNAMEQLLLDKELLVELKAKSFNRQMAFSASKFKKEHYAVYTKLKVELDESRNRT